MLSSCNPLRPVEGTETAQGGALLEGVEGCNPLRPVEGTETRPAAYIEPSSPKLQPTSTRRGY